MAMAFSLTRLCHENICAVDGATIKPKQAINSRRWSMLSFVAAVKSFFKPVDLLICARANEKTHNNQQDRTCETGQKCITSDPLVRFR